MPAARTLIAAVTAPFSNRRLRTTADGQRRDVPSETESLTTRRSNSAYGTTTFLLPPAADGTRRPLQTSPERIKNGTNPNGHLELYCVPEDDASGRGVVDNEEGASDDDDDSSSERERELDEELEEQGLYRGSYRRLRGLYSLVPITTIIAFTAFAFLPSIFHSSPSSPSSPHPPLTPFPVTELFISTSSWSLAHSLRPTILAFITSLLRRTSSPHRNHHRQPLLLFPPLHTILSLAFITLSFPIAQIPHHPHPSPVFSPQAFHSVWALAMGWAGAEAIVAIKQGYRAIALYKRVLVVPESLVSSSSLSPRLVAVGGDGGVNGKRRFLVNRPRDEEEGSEYDLMGTSSSAVPLTPPPPVIHDGDNGRVRENSEGEGRQVGGEEEGEGEGEEEEEAALEAQVESDLEELMVLRKRQQIEEVYGIPFIRIPVFVPCLQRLNALLFHLGAFLLVSAAYMRSFLSAIPPPFTNSHFTLAGTDSNPLLPLLTRSAASNTPLLITLPLIYTAQLLLAYTHTALVLPTIGVHTAVYVGSFVGLGTFFAGLGVWGVLV